MTVQRKIKRRAREALRGSVPRATLLLFLWLLAWQAVDLGDRVSFHLLGRQLGWGGAGEWVFHPAALGATAAALGVRLLLLTPLQAGAVTWFDGLMARRDRPLGTLFWPYGNRVWLRSLGVRLYAGAATGAVALLPLAGLGSAVWLLRHWLAALSPEHRALAAALTGVAAALWLLAAAAYAKRFSMAVLLLGPDYGCTAAEAIALSAECTRGYRWRLVWLDLTLLPWLASCLLVLPAVYALPYCAACRVGYSRYLYRRMLRKRQRQKGRDRDGTEHRV